MKVYVHVPFCRSKCAYCDFYSTPRTELMEKYVDTVGMEWTHRDGDGLGDISTIYVGGGTPSSLPVESLVRMLSVFPAGSRLAECTVEANPDDVTPGWVERLTCGTVVNRVSMGIQSFDDGELRFIGRRHSGRRAEEAFATLREGGIGNISCDLIYGLPGQTLRSWERSIERMLALRPEHISAYLLSYEPRTRLGVMLEQGKVEEADERTACAMYDMLCTALRRAGYVHYEISNFALPGREAIHNSGYWDGSDYIGLGPGAHSMIDGVRSYNPSDLRGYVASRGEAFGIVEEENELERLNDRIITSLRTSAGLDTTGLDAYPEVMAEVERLMAEGELIATQPGRVAIPEERWLRSDAVMRRLIVV